jgi:Holliday junction resolvase RusA-like endonuclease
VRTEADITADAHAVVRRAQAAPTWGVLLDIVVPAIPKPGGGFVCMGKAAKVVDPRSGRSFVPPETRAWMRKVQQYAAVFWRGRPPLDEPLVVTLDVVVPRPAGVPVGHTRESWGTSARVRCASKAGADADNHAKAVLDALTKARVWVDDGRVCELVVRRWYAAREDHGPDPVGVRVVVRRLASLTDGGGA